MKKQIKTFGEFTRHRLNESHRWGTWTKRSGYDQDEWFRRLKEYKQWIEELLGEYPYEPKLKIKSNHGQTDKEAQLATLVYFDSLSDSEEAEIVEKAKEINEYSQIGHDPQWKGVIYGKLRKLENKMFGYRMDEFERKSYQRELDDYYSLTQANGGSPYQLKKGMLDVDRSPILGIGIY